MKMDNPIFVALDVDSDTQALEIASKVSGFVGGYKLGPRLAVRYGAPLISKLAEQGLVFVDNKYYDIPNTVEAAVQATFDAGASFATVHAANGQEALERLAKLETRLNEQRPFKILVVTVLTSFSQQGFPPHWQNKPISAVVNDLAQLTVDSGLSGIVCSAEEVSSMREQHPNAFLLTPGIRLEDDSKGDQKRVVTPARAMQMGSSALVVGRPIVQASDPAEAAKRYFTSL